MVRRNTSVLEHIVPTAKPEWSPEWNWQAWFQSSPSSCNYRRGDKKKLPECSHPHVWIATEQRKKIPTEHVHTCQGVSRSSWSTHSQILFSLSRMELFVHHRIRGSWHGIVFFCFFLHLKLCLFFLHSNCDRRCILFQGCNRHFTPVLVYVPKLRNANIVGWRK
jgi:hypothetical protein